MRPDLDLTLRRFEHRLAAHRPASIAGEGLRHAAVAALLRFADHGPEVLLMKRAERPGDHWSGHVSFPGGRASPEDRDLLATAVRETREEVGMDLSRAARLLGQLDTIRAVARGRPRPLTITPFVFVQTEDMPLALGHEAADAFWFPLARAVMGELSDVYEYTHGPEPLNLPCWRFRDHVVWGLTHRMLQHLLEVVTARRSG